MCVVTGDCLGLVIIEPTFLYGHNVPLHVSPLCSVDFKLCVFGCTTDVVCPSSESDSEYI